MVDALRTAREWIVPSGRVIDLHPSAAPARIYVGERLAGTIDPGGATARHRAAADAIAAAARDRLLCVEEAFEFEFWTHAGSVEELDDYILENWRDSRIGSVTLSRARDLVNERTGSKVSAREIVSATRLRG